MKAFMLKQTRVKDLETFVGMSGSQVDTPEDVSMSVLIPAFITSELKTAFQIGFMLFLPFLDYRFSGCIGFDGNGYDDAITDDRFITV